MGTQQSRKREKMPSGAMKRSREKWLEYQKRREAHNWTKMSYFDKVRVGDMVEALSAEGNKIQGLVVATIDTVGPAFEPAWGDTHVLWNGNDKPSWEGCGSLEVISEGS